MTDQSLVVYLSAPFIAFFLYAAYKFLSYFKW